MFNLLLPKDKVTVYREYTLRLWIVIFAGIFCVIVAGIIFLLPSYVWLRQSESTVMDEKAQLGEVSQDQNLTERIANVDADLEGLHIDQKIVFKEMIERVVAARGGGIKLNAIEYAITDGKLHLELTGISATRDSLVAFSKALEKDPLYGAVQVPISSFVKDRNIEFSLSIEGK